MTLWKLTKWSFSWCSNVPSLYQNRPESSFINMKICRALVFAQLLRVRRQCALSQLIHRTFLGPFFCEKKDTIIHEGNCRENYKWRCRHWQIRQLRVTISFYACVFNRGPSTSAWPWVAPPPLCIVSFFSLFHNPAGWLVLLCRTNDPSHSLAITSDRSKGEMEKSSGSS